MSAYLLTCTYKNAYRSHKAAKDSREKLAPIRYQLNWETIHLDFLEVNYL